MQSRRQVVRCKISVKRYKARHLEFPDFLQYHDNSILPSRFFGAAAPEGRARANPARFCKKQPGRGGNWADQHCGGRYRIAEQPQPADFVQSCEYRKSKTTCLPAGSGTGTLDLPLGEAARAAMRHFDMTGRRSAAWMRGWISAAFSTRRKAVCQRRTARNRFLLFGFLDGSCPSCVYPPILHRGRKFPRRARPS